MFSLWLKDEEEFRLGRERPGRRSSGVGNSLCKDMDVRKGVCSENAGIVSPAGLLQDDARKASRGQTREGLFSCRI